MVDPESIDLKRSYTRKRDKQQATDDELDFKEDSIPCRRKAKTIKDLNCTAISNMVAAIKSDKMAYAEAAIKFRVKLAFVQKIMQAERKNSDALSKRRCKELKKELKTTLVMKTSEQMAANNEDIWKSQ